MIINHTIKSLEPSNYSDKTFKLNQITQCPICKKNISPIFLNGVYKVYENYAKMDCHFLCNGCEHTFIGTYNADMISSSSYRVANIVSVEPNHYTKEEFDKFIESLSPQFTKIYNQALAAETSGLDEIAGLGYRKSLEFLVKDFAIHENPDNEEDIKKLMLSPCIKKYIDYPQIKTLVERSAWIGNDEAHYIRKQADRDVSDMKAFIKATVYFIAMVLITEDAESIEPAK